MMKKLLVIGLLGAGLALAQRGGSKGGNGGDMGGAPMPMGRPTKLDMIAQALNLNKDQKKTVKGIIDDGAKEAAPLRDQISKTRIAVGEAIVAKKSDEELKQVAKPTNDASVKLTQLELETFSKVVATLDETQKGNKSALGQVLVLMNGIYHNKNWNED